MCFTRIGQSAVAGFVLALFCWLAAAGVQAAGTPAAGDGSATDRGARAELLMLRQDGCPWCEAWDEEIGPVYSKTDEGRQAPLREADISEVPDDVTLERPARYTPTFVLLEDGVEVGRIEGYPGEDFFWGLLGRLLKAPPQDSATPVRGGTTQ